MYLKPAPGLTIRDPDMFDFLPETGRKVPQTDYWHRRLHDGDVVKAEPPPEPPAAIEAAPDTIESTGA